jgi:molybdopterin converting factor small subunit
MKVTLSYFAQVRQAAGTESETMELPDGTDLLAALRKAAEVRGDSFRALVLTAAGELRPSLLLLVNAVPVPRDRSRPLAEGDDIGVFSPVSGG